MTAEITLVLVILGIAIVLFATERIRVDVISMMVLLALLFTGLLDTNEAFSGFSNPAVITVWAIYVISAGLTLTGVADFIGQRILRVAGHTEQRLVAVIMATVGSISAFMNNIGATAVLLPAVVSIGRRTGVPASKLLIPLAFGSLVGGVTTLIGTPPNLLVSTALADAGLEPFSLFDYTPMGLIVMISSISYMVLIGRRLLPSRPTHSERDGDLLADYELRDYLTELRVLSGSPLIGSTIAGSQLGEIHDLTVVGIIRRGRIRLGIMPNAHIREDDLLLVKGSVDKLLRVGREIGVAIDPHRRLSEVELISPEATVAEMVISQKADFVDRTLAEIDFRGRYGLTVLAIWRAEAPIVGRLDKVPLQLGDTLLVHARRERIDAIRGEGQLLLLAPVQLEQRRLRKAPLALVIFTGMILLVATGTLHISAAAVTGTILMVLSGCLTMDEAYNAIEWQSVFLIAGMLPMGIAMEKTGTADFLAAQIIELVGGLGPQAIMIGLFILTTIITEFMSNAAAAVLVAPIAISSALTLGADPRAFVMGVGIAASNSFLFPIGHQASVLVYGPGNYRFFDFTRVGLPLTLLIWVLLIIFLPIFWPLGV
ncbi:MAG: SLC13 family permease [Candidatus Promineifilaceae bacterium]|nr:SLC13 family permease [Candidatus Promineifilaceae bacterium]